MDIKEIESKVKLLDDIEQIKQVQIRYVNCLTTCKWNEISDCFAKDAVTDIGKHGVVKGKEEIDKLFKERVSRGHPGREGNFVVHPLISVEGDRAKGSWLLYLMKQFPHKVIGEDMDWEQGFYEAEYVREDGQWKISYLKFRIRLSSLRPPYPKD
jgi:ketosteroid isomerase-like protein